MDHISAEPVTGTALTGHPAPDRDAAVAARIADICASRSISADLNSQTADKPAIRCEFGNDRIDDRPAKIAWVVARLYSLQN